MILGIDIGGSYLRYELRKNNILVTRNVLKSVQTGLYAFLKGILDEHHTITTVFISYAGQVNNGVILSAPNIAIDEHNIKASIEEKYSVELFIENDLNCAVLAESALYKSNDICAISVGTGLGLGVISSTTLIKGFENIATELGHIPYKESPFTCNCGKKNCIELFCSGSGLMKWKKEYGLDESLTLKELKNSYNKDAKRIYDEFFKALFHAFGTIITLFNPQILVLGGGIILNNKYILQEVKKNIKNYALPLALKNIKIVHTQLKNASLEGAFLLKDFHA